MRWPGLDLSELCENRAGGFFVWLSPTDAEGAAGGIGVDLVGLVRNEIARLHHAERLEK